MPLVDRRTGRLVLRIAYVGPPEAGKATNLQQLCERLSPGQRSGLSRTVGHDLFPSYDWLDLPGGPVGGQRVRCQIATVPGPIELAHARRDLLDSADAVVFVADARTSAAPETHAALRSLARALVARADVPLVLQANKQDLPGAEPPERLHAALDLAARVPVIGAHATRGTGVLESFLLAVRLAADHVRALLVAGEPGAGDACGAAALVRALAADGREGFDAFDALDEIARAAAPAIGQAGPHAATAAGAPDAPGAVTMRDAAACRSSGATAASRAPAAPLALAPAAAPPTSGVASGLVWPPQAGRQALHELDAARAQGSALVPLGGATLRCGTWLLCLADDAWQDVDVAHGVLLATVARQPALAGVFPDRRAIAIADGGDGTYRMWQLAEVPRTLAELAEIDRAAAAAAIEHANRELRPRLDALAATGTLALDVSLETIDAAGAHYVGGAWLQLARAAQPIAELALPALAAPSAPAASHPLAAPVAPPSATTSTEPASSEPAAATDAEPSTGPSATEPHAPARLGELAPRPADGDPVIVIAFSNLATQPGVAEPTARDAALPVRAAPQAPIAALPTTEPAAVPRPRTATSQPAPIARASPAPDAWLAAAEPSPVETAVEARGTGSMASLAGRRPAPERGRELALPALEPCFSPWTAFLGTDDDPTWDLPAVEPGASVARGAAAELAARIEAAGRPLELSPGPTPPSATRRGAGSSTTVEVWPGAATLGVPPPPDPLPWQLPPVDLPAGLVWPGVTGRAALVALSAPVRVVRPPAPWAPASAIELECGAGWSAHSAPDLVFPDVDRGRPALFAAALWQSRLGDLAPPGRTYALSPDGDRVRLWVLTPMVRTLWSAIEDAFARGDRAAARELAQAGLAAVDHLRARGVPITDLAHLAVDAPPRLLATPWTADRDDLTEQLQQLFAAAVL